LLDHAFITAIRFNCAYRGYENERKAIAAFRRRAPGFSPLQYANAFSKALDLYTAALKEVDHHLPTLRHKWAAKGQTGLVYELRPFVGRLRRRAPGFLSSTYYLAINWIWFWHHLK
jgi:hypothetical protein